MQLIFWLVGLYVAISLLCLLWYAVKACVLSVWEFFRGLDRDCDLHGRHGAQPDHPRRRAHQ